MDCLGEFGSRKDTNGAHYKMRPPMKHAIVILMMASLLLGVEGLLQSRAIDGAQRESTDGGT